MKLALLIAFVLLASGCASAPGMTGDDVEFTTEDSVLIKGTLYGSGGSVVILVHQAGASREQWEPYVPLFLEKNYSVLAYDVRGHGESAGSISYDDMPKDVKAAIGYIISRDDLGGARIAVVGASLGGNIAYVSSSYPQVKAAVSMSPAVERLTGANIPGFIPRNVLFMSDDLEHNDAQLLYQNTQAPKDIRQYNGAGHGIKLMANTLVVSDMFEWLAKYI